MDIEQAVDYVKTDPNLTSEEKEFSVAFTKQDEKASFHTSIRSQITRALKHSDIEESSITVYNKDSDTYKRTTVAEFDGSGIIVSFVGKVPIESLKINSSPRSSRSYASIISPQTEVNFD